MCLFIFRFYSIFLLIFLILGVPVWPLIFYCLRCGDVSAAIQAADEAGPGKLYFFCIQTRNVKLTQNLKIKTVHLKVDTF